VAKKKRIMKTRAVALAMVAPYKGFNPLRSPFLAKIGASPKHTDARIDSV
jgi:hypothetical protein